jgi:hypothetical protein
MEKWRWSSWIWNSALSASPSPLITEEISGAHESYCRMSPFLCEGKTAFGKIFYQLHASKHGFASELTRLSDRRMSEKLVATFADGGCYSVRVTDPYGRILSSLDRSRYFFFHVTLQFHSRIWVDPELWPLDHRGRSTFCYITYINSVRTSQETQYISVLQPGTLTTRTQSQYTFFYITYINSVRTSQKAQYISVLEPGTLTTRPQRRSHTYIQYRMPRTSGLGSASWFHNGHWTRQIPWYNSTYAQLLQNSSSILTRHREHHVASTVRLLMKRMRGPTLRYWIFLWT